MESSGPDQFVKKEEKRTRVTMNQARTLQPGATPFNGAALTGKPLASNRRFQS